MKHCFSPGKPVKIRCTHDGCKICQALKPLIEKAKEMKTSKRIDEIKQTIRSYKGHMSPADEAYKSDVKFLLKICDERQTKIHELEKKIIELTKLIEKYNLCTQVTL